MYNLHQDLAIEYSNYGEARTQIVASRADFVSLTLILTCKPYLIYFEKLSKQGQYDEALALLCSEASLANGKQNLMSTKDIILWQRAIYSVWKSKYEKR